MEKLKQNKTNYWKQSYLNDGSLLYVKKIKNNDRSKKTEIVKITFMSAWKREKLKQNKAKCQKRSNSTDRSSLFMLCSMK